MHRIRDSEEYWVFPREGLEDPVGKDENEFIKTARIIEEKFVKLKSRINNLW